MTGEPRMTAPSVGCQTIIKLVIGCYFLSLTACASRLPISHRVQPGETLSTIAHHYGLSQRYLACLNGIRNPNLIHAGQQLTLPNRSHGAKLLKLRWPIRRGVLTSHFGPRRATCHRGIDIAAPIGTVIRAAAPGKVIYSGRMRGYGNAVIIRHEGDYNTVYAHNQKNRVRVGQIVRRGKKIATVGKSGRSTGPHLHFELRIGEIATDPILHLPDPPRKLRDRATKLPLSHVPSA